MQRQPREAAHLPCTTCPTGSALPHRQTHFLHSPNAECHNVLYSCFPARSTYVPHRCNSMLLEHELACARQLTSAKAASLSSPWPTNSCSCCLSISFSPKPQPSSAVKQDLCWSVQTYLLRSHFCTQQKQPTEPSVLLTLCLSGETSRNRMPHQTHSLRQAKAARGGTCMPSCWPHPPIYPRRSQPLLVPVQLAL